MNGLSFKNDDIVIYDPTQGTWSIFLDGSDIGLSKADLHAFAILNDGTIFMSFDKSLKIPTLGTVSRNDIVRFTPTALGKRTAGTFTWYLDGSDVGLSSSDEAIDAIAFDPSGRLVVSTIGNFRVNDLKGKDEDLWVFDSITVGEESAGAWSLYFDGSDVALSKGSEDIDALWIDPTTGALYLSTKGDFAVEGSTNTMRGEENDLLICTPIALGQDSDCIFTLFLEGNALGYRENIDSFAPIDPTLAAVLTTLRANASSIQVADDPDTVEPFAIATEVIEEIDPESELDEYDIIVADDQDEEESRLPERIYLPLIQQ